MFRFSFPPPGIGKREGRICSWPVSLCSYVYVSAKCCKIIKAAAILWNFVLESEGNEEEEDEVEADDTAVPVDRQTMSVTTTKAACVANLRDGSNFRGRE